MRSSAGEARPMDEFTTLLMHVAEQVGVPITDVGDEHQRGRVYLAADERPEHDEALFALVGMEPFEQLALSIVLRVIGRMPHEERHAWVDQLSSEYGQAYAARRAAELAVYQTRPLAPLLTDGIEQSWSDWLQLMLAEFSPEPEVLAWLAERGRTKRIMRLSRESLRKL
jgi:hypothetical protein